MCGKVGGGEGVSPQSICDTLMGCTYFWAVFLFQATVKFKQLWLRYWDVQWVCCWTHKIWVIPAKSLAKLMQMSFVVSKECLHKLLSLSWDVSAPFHKLEPRRYSSLVPGSSLLLTNIAFCYSLPGVGLKSPILRSTKFSNSLDCFTECVTYILV